ncbi:hypothetical protein ABJI51_05070 [Amycolatopsis sp. NEAU-NG30]|uniref:Uncharacterized protein n=1 Tax=Amycolatopsis melonis TaxID=3156488 RepID=A0ABV0L800_9PSEU
MAAEAVRFEPRLGLALLGFDGTRMRDDVRPVSVGWLADVPAVSDVGAQPAPGLLQGVEDLVLGDGLVDPPLQDALGAAAGERQRLVGGEERDVGSFQFSLDREAFEGAPGDAGDVLADHHVEAAVGTRRLVEEVGDAARAGNWDVEALVPFALAALVEFEPAGFDVEEVGRDDPGRGQGVLAVRELAQDGLAWVLLVFGRGAGEERDADLVVQQRAGHAQRGDGVVGQARGRCPVLRGHASAVLFRLFAEA